MHAVHAGRQDSPHDGGWGADARLKMHGGETALTFAVMGSTDIDESTLGKCQTQTVRLLLDRAPDLKLHDRVADRAARWFET